LFIFPGIQSSQSVLVSEDRTEIMVVIAAQTQTAAQTGGIPEAMAESGQERHQYGQQRSVERRHDP